MDVNIYDVLETTGAVALTISLVSSLKGVGVNVKFLPLLSLAVGVVVVWSGAASGLFPVDGWSIVWHGLMTGIMATGGWSGVKNVLEGFRNGD